MKHIIKNAFFSIIVSSSFIYIQHRLASSFISNFLKDNLITIVLSLLAINIATTGIVLGKMNDITNQHQNKTLFSKSKREMQISIMEQICLLILALLFLTTADSSSIKPICTLQNTIDICCLAIFVYDVIILYDSSKSIFVILS